MSILNIGSINCDHVYHVPHFLLPGETLACTRYERHLGGKGMNQSIALLRAGAKVSHLGAVQTGDAWMLEAIAATGLPTDHILQQSVETGHAIIQVDAGAQNCILLNPGANHAIQAVQAQATMAQLPSHGWVLLQNETSVLGEAIELAVRLGKKVALNPAPCHPDLAKLPLEKLSLLVVNEIEAVQLTSAANIQDAFAALRQRCPNTLVVMTLGADGLQAAQGEQTWTMPAVPTTVVDTTAAGDTITGYVLAGLDVGMSVELALKRAMQAAAITVSRAGASTSIPFAHELG